MRCVAQGMSPKTGDARGIYTAKLAAVGGWRWREYGSRAGRVSFKFRDKCGFP
jgi:hypothetical protein